MSSSDNENKDAAELSLAELLGQQAGAPTGDYDGLDDDQKRNEQGSGLINLSAMVGTGALGSPKPTPAPQNAAPPAAAPLPAATDAGLPPTSGQAPMAAAPPKKAKSKIGLIAGIAAVAVIAAAAGIYVALSKQDEANKAKIADMKSELAKMLAQAEATEDEAKKKEIQAQIATRRAELAQQVADAGEKMDISADETTDEMDITADETGKAARTSAPRRRRVTKRTASKRSPASTTAAKATNNTTSSLTDTLTKKSTAKSAVPDTKTKTSNSKTAALDNLLVGSGGGGGGGLPVTPTRSQVQSVMNKVQGKARATCSKSGSGVVKVRVVVGSNGRVRDAVPTGQHAADSLGRCVSTIARRTARFPAFSKPTFSFTYPVRI